MILECMSDIHSLSALVHASPTCHAAYRANREKIFTTVTLRTLWARGIKVLPPCTTAQTFGNNVDFADQAMKSAFSAVFNEVETPVKAQIVIRSSIGPSCLAGIAANSNPFSYLAIFEALSQVSGGKPIKLSLEHCLRLLRLYDNIVIDQYGSENPKYMLCYQTWGSRGVRECDYSEGLGVYHSLVFLHNDSISVAGTFDLNGMSIRSLLLSPVRGYLTL